MMGTRRHEINKLTCYFCKKPGHVKKDCYKFKAAKDREGSGNYESARREVALIAHGSTYSGEVEKWYADSGASSHMTCDGEGLYNKEKIKENVKIGNGKALPCKTKGDLVLHAEGKITVHLKGVLLVPGLRNNLISLSKITKSPDTEIRLNREYIMMEKKDADPLQLFAREDGEIVEWWGTAAGINQFPARDLGVSANGLPRL